MLKKVICAITSQAQYKIENIQLFGEMNEFSGIYTI